RGGTLADHQGVPVLAHHEGLLARLQPGRVLHAAVAGVGRELHGDLLAVGPGDRERVVGDAVLFAPVVGDVLEAVLAPDDEIAVDDAAEDAVAPSGLAGGLLVGGRRGIRRGRRRRVARL